jgi:hypothetical protein
MEFTAERNNMDQPKPMTVESVRELLEEAGAKVMARSGRTENYSAPREFSFEVRGAWPNGLALHVVARQFIYRDPWEAEGRVNDLVDVALLRDGSYSSLPRGYDWFQGRDEESGIDEDGLRRIAAVVSGLNPKIFKLQELTGDL